MRVFTLVFIFVLLSSYQSVASSSTCKSFLNKKDSQNSEQNVEPSTAISGFFARIFGTKKSNDESSSKENDSLSPNAETEALIDVQTELSHILFSGMNSVELIDLAIVKASEALGYDNQEIPTYSKKTSAVNAAQKASESAVTYFEDLDLLEQAYINLNAHRQKTEESLGLSVGLNKDRVFNLFSSNSQLSLEVLINDLENLRNQFLILNGRVEIELDNISAQLAETI